MGARGRNVEHGKRGEVRADRRYVAGFWGKTEMKRVG